MKWIGICSIYLNHTSSDIVQALFYINVLGMHFTTKYKNFNAIENSNIEILMIK